MIIIKDRHFDFPSYFNSINEIFTKSSHISHEIWVYCKCINGSAHRTKATIKSISWNNVQIDLNTRYYEIALVVTVKITIRRSHLLIEAIVGELWIKDIRATSHMSQEPWPWNCESPIESIQRPSQIGNPRCKETLQETKMFCVIL